MKRTIILLALILSSAVVFAQKSKVATAKTLKDSGKLDKALEAIKEAIDPNNEKAVEGSLNWPNTWEALGEIYQAIFQSKDEAIKKLESDPLTKALESYKKALQLDEKGRIANSIKIKLTLLVQDLQNQAIERFNKEDYQKAMESFEQVLEIQEINVIKKDNPTAIDTVIIFNTGLAAFNAKNYEKAIKYYGDAAKYNYGEGRSYDMLAKSYLLKNDTIGAMAALQEGFKKYPSDNGILVQMINIYLFANKVDDAMKYLDMAIAQDPKNASYHFAKGTLYEKLQDETNAIKSYENAFEVQPDFSDAYYNLGALYYNKGVKQIETANAVPANENARYEAELKKADQWFEKSLPLMEKCNQIKPDDVYSLESLKNLYYRLKMMDKFNAVLEKLGQKK